MAKVVMTEKAKAQALRSIDVMVGAHQATAKGVYHEIVATLFWRILKETPQFSGNAVAHWTIGINAPAPAPVVNVPKVGRKRLRRLAGEIVPLQRGNSYWINQAWARESPKIPKIGRKDKVYISNYVLGESGELYMELLQNPSYWSKRLRAVNKPYEVVQDSVAYVVGAYQNKRTSAFDAWTRDYGAAP